MVKKAKKVPAKRALSKERAAKEKTATRRSAKAAKSKSARKKTARKKTVKHESALKRLENAFVVGAAEMDELAISTGLLGAVEPKKISGKRRR
jgi:hypothetical protein